MSEMSLHGSRGVASSASLIEQLQFLLHNMFVEHVDTFFGPNGQIQPFIIFFCVSKLIAFFLSFTRELAELQKDNAVTQSVAQEAALSAEQIAREELKSIMEQQKVAAQREKESLLVQVISVERWGESCSFSTCD